MIEGVLKEKADILDREMLAFLGSSTTELQAPMLHLIRAGGKRIRPALCLLACRCVGGKEEDALLPAVAVELIHNFSLVHDDIMDGDLLRRGKPTTHAIYGVPLSINAGDALFAKAFCAIAEAALEPAKKETVLKVLSSCVFQVCAGQAMDLGFPKRPRVSVGEYLEMVEKKTGVLLESAAKIGAVCGGGSDKQVEALGKFAHNIGIAFQIRDDIMGVAGKTEKTGKSVGNDIREGKRTIIVLHALENLPAKERKVLERALGNKKAGRKQIGDAAALLEKCGSIAYAKKQADALVSDATAALDVFPGSEAKRSLVELGDFIVRRSY